MNTTRCCRLACVCLLAFGAFWAHAGPVQAEIIDRVVARVGDEVITRHDVRKAAVPFLVRKGMSTSALEDPNRRRAIFDEVLERMIDRHLIEKEAERNDLSVSDKKIDRALSLMRRRNQLGAEQFRNLVESYGISFEEYRDTVRLNLLKRRLVKQQLGRKISISQEEVDRAYREKFGAPKDVTKQITLRQILVRADSPDDPASVEKARDRAESILDKLESGASFKGLAETRSEGPSADDRGLLGTFTRQELNPAFRETAFNLEAGEHSGVVRTKFGFHIFRVDSVTTKAANDQTGKRKQRIRQMLRGKKLQKQVDVYLRKLRREAFVDVKVDFEKG